MSLFFFFGIIRPYFEGITSCWVGGEAYGPTLTIPNTKHTNKLTYTLEY